VHKIGESVDAGKGKNGMKDVKQNAGECDKKREVRGKLK
jgi:hypothetical protein